MDARSSSLQQLLWGGNQYVIPVFQRYYSWKKKDWQQLWGDIESLLEPEEIPRHFMGPLVFVANRTSVLAPRYLVIDGQQRLVTLSVLLSAARNIAQQREYGGLAEEIEEKFLVDRHNRTREGLKLLPRQRDREDYISIVLEGRAPDGPLGRALTHFTERLNGLDNSYSQSAFRNLVMAVVAGLEFVVVTLDNENPYEIFRSLNATGVPLSEADLIRNFVFMTVEPDAIDSFDEHQWQAIEKVLQPGVGGQDLLTPFFRDFLMKDGKYVSPRAVFSSFESRYGNSAPDPRKLAEELTTYAGYYRVIRGIVPGPPLLRTPLQKLVRLESSTTYPLLLNLYARAQAGEMPIDELADALELIAGFILRRLVCQESSRLYGRWFVAACHELGDNPLQGLRLFLEERGFPADKRFEHAFVSYDLYHSGYGRPVLLELESALSMRHKEPVDLSQATMEHIMPQTLTGAWRAELADDAEQLQTEWLHTLGNLTLSAYNSGLSNSPFATKRRIYQESNVIMNRDIAAVDTWKGSEIVARGERLAQLACRIWPGPSQEPGAAVPHPGIGESTEQADLYTEYWDAFLSALRESGSRIASIASPDGGNLHIPMGDELGKLVARISAGRSRFVLIVLSLTGPNRYQTFRALKQNRADIEGEIGRSLYWSGRPKESDSQIFILLGHSNNPGDRGQWPQQQAWLQQYLEPILKAFAPRLEDIAGFQVPQQHQSDAESELNTRN